MSANDPVSEFLAREQSALADLGDEDLVPDPPTRAAADSANNVGNQNGFYSGGGGEQLTNGTATDLDMFVENNTTTTIPPHNGQFFEADETMNQLGDTRISPTLSHTRGQSNQPEEEPENLRKWREQQEELIKKKDSDEEKKKDELRQHAKKELEEMHAKRNAELEQRKKQNRERQATFGGDAAKSTDKEVNAALWERVARMIEGTTSTASSTGGGGGAGKMMAKPAGQCSALGKDTTRMKQLIMLYARGEPNEKSPSPEVP